MSENLIPNIKIANVDKTKAASSAAKSQKSSSEEQLIKPKAGNVDIEVNPDEVLQMLNSVDSVNDIDYDSILAQFNLTPELFVSSLEDYISQSQDDILEVNMGTDESVSEMQDMYNAANTQFNQLLEIEAQQNEAIAGLKSSLDEVNLGISQNEAFAFYFDTQITDTNVKISKQNDTINSLDSEIASYDKLLSNLQNAASKCSDAEFETINEKIMNIQDQKGIAQAQKKNEETTLNSLNERVKMYEEQQKEYNKQLDELKSQRDKIEQKISNSGSAELKKALSNMQDARNELETLKENTINEIKGDISDYSDCISAIEETNAQNKAEEFYNQENVPVSEMTPEIQSQVYSEPATNEYGGTASSPAQGGGGFSGSAAPGASAASSSRAVETAPKENIQENYDNAISELQDSKDALSGLYNGENEELNALKEKENDSFDSVIESIEDEEIKQQAIEKKEELDAKLKEIDEKDAQILEEQNAIDELNTQLSAIDVQISALNEQKSQLSSVDTSKFDSEKMAQYNQKVSELEAKIAELEEQKQKIEDEIKEKEDNIKTLQQDKETLQKDTETLKSELQELIKEADEKKVEEYNESSSKYDDTKKQLESDLKSDVTNKKAQADELYKTLSQKEAQELASQYAFSGSIPSSLAQALDNKLGAGFSAKVEEVARNINCDPEDLIGLMQSESGLNPAAKNPHGSATGLIQFLESTANGLGTTTAALKQMSATEQMNYVQQYFLNHKRGSTAKLTAGDLYTYTFLPGYINRDVLCTRGDKYYNSNSGLDSNGDGQITKSELGARVQNKYKEVLNKYA